MTKKTLEAAKRAADAARRAKAKLDKIAALKKDEDAAALVAEAARDASEAALAAAEAEAEAQRQVQLHERMEKEDPTLWQRVKKWSAS